MPRSRSTALATFALGASYVVVAWLGTSVHAPTAIPSLLWAPSGIALAFVLLYGPVVTLGVAIGAFVALILRGADWWIALGIGGVDALETLLAYYVLRHYDFHVALDRMRDVVAFVGTVVLVSLLSATTTTSALTAIGSQVTMEFPELWWKWSWGHLSGDLIVAPLILTWARSARTQRFGRPHFVEFVVVGLAVVAVVIGVFTNWLPGSRMPHYLFPLLIWSALRFGPRGAATTNAVITACAVVGMMYQTGPFGELADFQSFVSVSAVATLALGAMRVEVIRAFRRKAAIQHAALDAIVTVDSRDRILEFNPAAERLFGICEASAIGRDVKQMFMPSSVRAEQPDSIARYVSEHSDAILGKRIRYTARHSDGHEFPAEVAVTKVPVDDEQLYTGFVRDISAEVQAEASRRESRRMLQQKVEERTAELRRGEELMRDAQELAHLGSFDFELDSGALDWSDEMYRIYGQDPKSFVPTYPAILGAVHPEDRAEVTEAIEAAISRGTPFSLEQRIIRPDGSVRVIQSQGRVLHGGDCRGARIMGCCQDITERKQAEVERSRLVALVESSADAIMLLSLDGTIETWNAAAEKMFGYTAREIVGHHADMLVARDHVESLDGRLVDVASHERTQMYELVHQRRDGTGFEASVMMSCIHDHRGRVIGISKVMRDTTEQKRSRDQLAASLQEKEVLLREIHHRVKNNLQVISSLLNLQVASVPNEAARKGLVESQTRIQSMALLHQLLYQSKDLARIELGDYLQALVNYLVATYNAKDRKISATVTAPAVRLDLDQAIPCGLIVNELVTNSLRHAFSGRTSGKIEIRVVEVEGGRLRIEVCDDGVGIPPNISLETMQSFGLQIARSLAEQLEGTIEILREQGTVIRVEFPINDGHDEATDTPRPSAATG